MTILDELIVLAQNLYSTHPRNWLKELYTYWKNKPIAKHFCQKLENSGILEIS